MQKKKGLEVVLYIFRSKLGPPRLRVELRVSLRPWHW